MKPTFLTLLFGLVMMGSHALAADEVTLTGTGMCAKCELKEADKCQNVLKVKDGDKETTYYMTKKMKHGLFCKGENPGITATGTVEEKDGKMMLTPSKIEEGGGE